MISRLVKPLIYRNTNGIKRIRFRPRIGCGYSDADNMLNYPDFRAYEHAFTMMAQVSGRVGRKGKQGLVILQTKNPELPVIQQVVNNSYMAFYKSQLEERTAFHYPPFFPPYIYIHQTS